MLIKILFTFAVIAAVVIFFRHRQARATGKVAEAAAAGAEGGSLSPRIVAFGMLGVLLTISLLIFAFNWHADNRIVHIRVISDDAAITTYRTRHKSIKGRNFVTLDGVRVTLGESDRIEVIEP